MEKVDKIEGKTKSLESWNRSRLAQQADEERLSREAEEQRLRDKPKQDAEKKTLTARTHHEHKLEAVTEKRVRIKERDTRTEEAHYTRRDHDKRVRAEQATAASVSERAANKIPESDFPTNPFPE